MKKIEQCAEVIKSGVLGNALLVVAISEGSWIDRMVISAMSHKVFNRPAKNKEEVNQLTEYWSKHADNCVIYEYLETIGLTTENVTKAEFVKHRNALAKLL